MDLIETHLAWTGFIELKIGSGGRFSNSTQSKSIL